MKKILFILLFILSFININSETITDTKYIDGNIENIEINFPATLYFCNNITENQFKIDIEINDNDIYKNVFNDKNIYFVIKGDKLIINNDDFYYDINYDNYIEFFKYKDPAKIKIYLPIKFLNKIESKYSFLRIKNI